MKRRYLIIIVAQAVLLGLMVIFTLIQKREADKQRELAEETAREAQEQRIIAEHAMTDMQSQVNSLNAELTRFRNEQQPSKMKKAQ